MKNSEQGAKNLTFIPFANFPQSINIGAKKVNNFLNKVRGWSLMHTAWNLAQTISPTMVDRIMSFLAI